MSKYKTKDEEWYQKTMSELDKVKFRCKCGHKVVIPAWVDRQICDWCGNYVYKNKEIEFKHKLKGAINSAKAKN